MGDWIARLLLEAGPYAGWVLSGLLVSSALWLYATDRLVSRGRHAEQATFYERELAKQDEHCRTMTDEARKHFVDLLRASEERVEAYRDDRDYWREVSLDLMGTVAATVSRGETGDGA